MFIRRKKKIDTFTKQEYTSYQLVESFRTERGPRQRILLNLGSNLEQFSDTELKELANCIENKYNGLQSLIKYSKEIESLAKTYILMLARKDSQPSLPITPDDNSEVPDYATVDLKTLSNEHCRSIGIENILYKAARDLEIPTKLAQLGFSESQVQIAIANIIARAANPASELATHEWLNNNTALNELMNFDFKTSSLYKLYQASDNLMKHKEAIEKHLSTVEKVLFKLDEKIILYDLTNTYFEGLAKGNKKAKFARSKERRSDCPLVAMGLILDADGFPKRSEFFEGNVSESKTFQQMIRQLDSNNLVFKPMIAMDAGIATDENILWLQKNKYPYVVVNRKKTQVMPQDVPHELVKEEVGSRVWIAKKTVKTESSKAPELNNKDFPETQQNDVPVADQKDAQKSEQTEETFLYCRSEARERREGRMKTKKEQLFEDELKKLDEGLSKTTNTIKKYDKVLEKVGKLREKYKKVAPYYEVEVSKDIKSELAIKITWEKNENKASKKLTGVYCLRSQSTNISDKELWGIYMMLTELEDAFRYMKSELGLRPVFHQKENRVDGHIFITILAYHLTHVIRKKLKVAGINLRWENIRMAMSTQVRITTCMKRVDGELVKIRNTSKADAFQKQIYDALGMTYEPLKSVRIRDNL